ncbi:MAG TPA: hypothetical protein VHS03_06170 [Gaiellaceae bacterium]|nr:hypothetical protein [Gaiellaceae bacterium]
MIAGLFSGDIGLGVVIVLAVVAIVAMIIVARLLRRDSMIRVTRLGWFVERERFEDEPLIVERHEHTCLQSTSREIDVDEDTKTWPATPPEQGGKQ